MRGKIESTETLRGLYITWRWILLGYSETSYRWSHFPEISRSPPELCSLSIQSASHSITRAASLQQIAACVSQGWRRSTYPLPTVRNVSGLALITTRVRGLLKLEDVCSGYRSGIWECPFPHSLNLTAGTEDLAGTLELPPLIRSI